MENSQDDGMIDRMESYPCQHCGQRISAKALEQWCALEDLNDTVGDYKCPHCGKKNEWRKIRAHLVREKYPAHCPHCGKKIPARYFTETVSGWNGKAGGSSKAREREHYARIAGDYWHDGHATWTLLVEEHFAEVGDTYVIKSKQQDEQVKDYMSIRQAAARKGWAIKRKVQKQDGTMLLTRTASKKRKPKTK
jgi:DNA-directed RNA polymerase subunit RPC12/RpoP